MIEFSTGGYLVENVAELPNLTGETIYCDLETTSGHPEKKSIDPFINCRIAGICIKSKSSPAYYIPVQHNDPYDKYNLPEEEVKSWLIETLNKFKNWHNQNIKYDAHVLINQWGYEFPGRYICTLNSQARLYDSERVYKGGYSLEVLAEAYLNKDIYKFKKSLDKFLLHSQDFGDIDPLVLGTYGCQDVITDEELDEFYTANLPEDMQGIVDLEIDTTKSLIKMEQVGVRIKPVQVREERIKSIIRKLQIEQEFMTEFGRAINCMSTKQMEDVICNIYGMPVLAYTNEDDDTKESNPSFSKDVLKEYMTLVDAPVWFLERALEYRQESQYESLFLSTYEEKNLDGILHAWFNQIIRTGRMSCSSPNMQQLSSRAKRLIIPNHPGYSIFRADYSQIEQRIIYDYIGQDNLIQQFLDNPDVDTYIALANLIGCSRKPAKTISLGSGYGMGVQKLSKNLSAIKEIFFEVKEKLEKKEEYNNCAPERQKVMLQKALDTKSKGLYKQFHRRVHRLKPVSKQAESICRRRKYVRTKLGRRRHIENPKFARKAFNAACQGSAADLIKCKINEFVLDVLVDTPIKLLLQVHDELVFLGPTEIISDYRFQRDVFDVMENNPLPMKIPIRVDGGWSDKNWYDATLEEDDEGFDPTRHSLKLPLNEKGSGERLEWLKKKSLSL